MTSEQGKAEGPLRDRFGRSIYYLRISVTDRCNLRCRYCMPETGVQLIPHEELLSFEEIVDFTRVAVSHGFYKVRLTGGEPLVRREIVALVEMLAGIEGITDLTMTTNGILLEKYARSLKAAGLHRLNVSLDAMDPERFRFITRGGDIERVLKGLEAAKAAGFDPIKINTVVGEGMDQRDALAVRDFAEANGYQMRTIGKMDLEKGEFWAVSGGEGGVCQKCNRIRLTSHGIVKPCLFSDLGYSIRELGAEKALFQAIAAKPEEGSVSHSNTFYAVGG